ncbi:T9SS type A sorting domain-containing protein, partial [Flavobacterium sp. MK4S-17]|uniref:T9SS type A sorting domain-containing protein n=1 Tax=Flavobacterium sp. MK4S-17 TaxID=2543737 RepID=UPI0013572400
DANGCEAAQSFTITQPTALTASASAQTNIACNGAATGSATVAVTGGTAPYTYAWSPSGGTAATATGLAAGTYTVTVTDANGCEAAQSFTITQPLAVVINTQPEDSDIATGDNTSFEVEAENADSYQWQVSTNGTDWEDVADGGNNPAYSGATTDVLTLTGVPADYNGYSFRVLVINGEECITTSEPATLTVTNVIEAVNDDFSTVTINEGTGGVAGDVTLNDLLNSVAVNDADITISITDNGGLAGITVDADGNINVPASATEGTYTVVYSICENVDNTNCSSAEVIIVVSPPLRVKDFNKTSVNIYPNPATSTVNVEIKGVSYDNLDVVVCDLNGRIVKKQRLGSGLTAINISSFEEGIYIFSIVSDSGVISKRIIKSSN